jgi:hypothetical protein
MADEMADFLYLVSCDPGLLRRLEANPDAVLDATGMSEQDKAILKSGDESRIRAALGDVDIGFPITVNLRA